MTFNDMRNELVNKAGTEDNDTWLIVGKFDIAETLANLVRSPEHVAMQRKARLALKAAWEANFS